MMITAGAPAYDPVCHDDYADVVMIDVRQVGLARAHYVWQRAGHDTVLLPPSKGAKC
jgi:hypothetical protein